MRKLNEPLDKKLIKNLKAGDEILFSGVFYTARDQAHRRLVKLIKNKKNIPFEIKNKIFYYCGPTETPKGKIIGSCGPTTSARMDFFLEPLLKKGFWAMVGKGRRSKEAKALIRKYGAVYFLAPAGCGAMLSQFVLDKKLVCFGDLGPEAVYRLEVKEFPLIVGIDLKGESVYK